MKKLFFLMIMCLLAVSLKAQTAGAKRATLNEQSIVKDSSGMVYPYVAWKKLLSTGNYRLRLENPGQENTAFLLVKLTEDEKQQRISNAPKPPESNFFTTGEAITPFRVKDIFGNKIEAANWAGKTVVLNFWFIGCPPCRAEIPELNKLAEKYKNNPNVIFIGVALDEGWEVRDFIKQNPFGYHLMGDGRFIAQQKFKISLYPTNVVVDKHGKVQFHSSGFAQNTPYWIERTILESLHGD